MVYSNRNRWYNNFDGEKVMVLMTHEGSGLGSSERDLRKMCKGAKFVVVNDYLDGIIDINKSADGTETDVVGENNMVKVDCLKAKALLKLKMRHKDELEGR